MPVATGLHLILGTVSCRNFLGKYINMESSHCFVLCLKHFKTSSVVPSKLAPFMPLGGCRRYATSLCCSSGLFYFVMKLDGPSILLATVAILFYNLAWQRLANICLTHILFWMYMLLVAFSICSAWTQSMCIVWCKDLVQEPLSMFGNFVVLQSVA